MEIILILLMVGVMFGFAYLHHKIQKIKKQIEEVDKSPVYIEEKKQEVIYTGRSLWSRLYGVK